MADSQEKDQKTEPATPRRKQEARENGQVALSNEFVAALMLVAAFGSVLFGGGYIARAAGGLTESTLRTLGTLGTAELDVESSAALVKDIGFSMVGPLLVVLAPALLVGALVAYGQVGFMVTAKAVELDPSKVDPIKGFHRLFSARAVVRTALAAAKVLAISLVMGAIAYRDIDDIARVGDSDLGPIL